MNKLILDAESANSPIEELLKRAASGGLEVCDSEGNVLAYVLSPTDREAWTYAEANVELDQHRGEIEQARGRSGGLTTAELLQKAASADQEQNTQG